MGICQHKQGLLAPLQVCRRREERVVVALCQPGGGVWPAVLFFLLVSLGRSERVRSNTGGWRVLPWNVGQHCCSASLERGSALLQQPHAALMAATEEQPSGHASPHPPLSHRSHQRARHHSPLYFDTYLHETGTAGTARCTFPPSGTALHAGLGTSCTCVPTSCGAGGCLWGWSPSECGWSQLVNHLAVT